MIVVGTRPARGFVELAREIPVRLLEVPGAGYYTLKNAGANAAEGKIVVFSDADVRPGNEYLRHIVRALDGSGFDCAVGRSLYDGTGLPSRINSIFNFGESHRGQAAFDAAGLILAHNVAVRRSTLPLNPFGPIGGRVGGDRYLTDGLRAGGHRIKVVDEAVVFHEDITWKLRGTVERHVREHFLPRPYGRPRQRFSLAFTLASVLGLRPALRMARIVRIGGQAGVRLVHLPIALIIDLVYFALDIPCVLAVLTIPPLRRRWFRYQYGVAGARPETRSSGTPPTEPNKSGA